jgi:hypothetical protein
MAWVLTSDMEGTYGSAGKLSVSREVLKKPATIELSIPDCGNAAKEANRKFRLASSEKSRKEHGSDWRAKQYA